MGPQVETEGQTETGQPHGGDCKYTKMPQGQREVQES